MRIMRTIIQLSGFISLWLLALVKQKREKGQYLKYHVKFFKRLFIINILSIIIFITHKKRNKFSDRIMKVKLLDLYDRQTYLQTNRPTDRQGHREVPHPIRVVILQGQFGRYFNSIQLDIS